MRKIILADVDNTLLDFNQSEKMALAPILEEYNLVSEENFALYSKINLANWKRLEKKEINREQCITLRWSEFFSRFGITVDAKATNDGYFKRLREGAYWMNGAEDFLRKAIQNGYEIYLVTNGVSDVQHNRVNKIGLDKYINGMYISDEIGYAKPDKRFFEYVLDDIRATNDDFIVVLGDSLTSDIAGAINANLKYIWFDFSNQGTSVKPKITSLSQFFEEVEAIK